MLDLLSWQDVAMLELKESAGDGTSFLMEINGRFWGSLQLAVDAGVDFPRLLVGTALGGRPEPTDAYRLGVWSRWLLGDLDHLVLRLTRSVESPHLPEGAPSRVSVVARFIRDFLPPTRIEVLCPGDPRPLLQEARLCASL